MSSTSNRMSSTAMAGAEPRFGPDQRPLAIVRSRQARRLRLAVDPRTGAVRLSLPARARLAAALAWVEDHRPWIEQQIARLPQSRPLADGTCFALGDDELTVTWSATGTRTVRRDGALLHVGGPQEMVAARVLRWLKREALAVLTAETLACAARAGVAVGRVSVADPRSRWGSCAVDGTIRYSWRLILAPAFVRRATVAHEVAHRAHMNHGPAFHALVADLFGENPAPARAWLRANGAALHWFGR